MFIIDLFLCYSLLYISVTDAPKNSWKTFTFQLKYNVLFICLYESHQFKNQRNKRPQEFPFQENILVKGWSYVLVYIKILQVKKV